MEHAMTVTVPILMLGGIVFFVGFMLDRSLTRIAKVIEKRNRESVVMNQISKLTNEMAMLGLDIEKYTGAENKRRHNRIVEINGLLDKLHRELLDDEELEKN